MCPFQRRRPFFAESKSFAKVIAGLYRFLVPLFSKTLVRERSMVVDLRLHNKLAPPAYPLHWRQ